MKKLITTIISLCLFIAGTQLALANGNCDNPKCQPGTNGRYLGKGTPSKVCPVRVCFPIEETKPAFGIPKNFGVTEPIWHWWASLKNRNGSVERLPEVIPVKGELQGDQVVPTTAFGHCKVFHRAPGEIVFTRDPCTFAVYATEPIRCDAKELQDYPMHLVPGTGKPQAEADQGGK